MICRDCQQDKPPEDFPIRPDRMRLRPYCKACANLKAREHYARNPDPALNRRKRWVMANRDKIRADYAARHARIRRQTIKLTKEQRAEIKAIYLRAIRLTKTTGEKYEVDHIIPLNHPRVCGLHVPWNLQVLPRELNGKKSNKVSLDALARTRLLIRHDLET